MYYYLLSEVIVSSQQTGGIDMKLTEAVHCSSKVQELQETSVIAVAVRRVFCMGSDVLRSSSYVKITVF